MLYTYLYCFFIYAFLGWCGEVLYAAARTVGRLKNVM